MAFKKLVSPTLTELFVSELQNMILSGQLKVGEKLPTERELANEMNVSLSVIHGGITTLASQGFLNIIPRRGVFVADYVKYGNISTMEILIENAGSNFTNDILKPLAELRRSIELASTKDACTNRTDKHLEVLKRIVSDSKTANVDQLIELAFEFVHEASIASGNIYYPMIIQTFKPIYVAFYRRIIGSTKQYLQDKLQNLYVAINDKDSEAASEIINKSIDHWVDFEEEKHK